MPYRRTAAPSRRRPTTRLPAPRRCPRSTERDRIPNSVGASTGEACGPEAAGGAGVDRVGGGGDSAARVAKQEAAAAAAIQQAVAANAAEIQQAAAAAAASQRAPDRLRAPPLSRHLRSRPPTIFLQH